METPVEYNAGKKEEERFVIKKQINYHPPYGGWCGDGKEIVFTRQEAIEKIQKAIFPLAHNLRGDNSVFNDCYFMAQAALNALLGE